ncbi:response regulator, partial [bacterium]|nr:response regulator [bacterium]
KELIDLILLDMVMPGMTGEEVFKEVRLSLSYLPILIHSGYHRDANIDALLKSGNAGFIQKPYTYEKLQEEIKKLFL